MSHVDKPLSRKPITDEYRKGWNRIWNKPTLRKGNNRKYKDLPPSAFDRPPYGTYLQ